jgi:hypothetical protein
MMYHNIATTNNGQHMVKSKRAPGGGRKPKGDFAGKAAWLSTRITPELRQNLNRAAQESGRSLSQEIERRLRASFGIQRERNPSLRALFFLFAETARQMPFFSPFFRTHELRSDPFTFHAFKFAVIALLERLAPPGQIVLHWPEDMPELAREDMPEWASSPDEVGRLLARLVWFQLETVEPPPPDIAAKLPGDLSWGYAYAHARRDLGVAPSDVRWDRKLWDWYAGEWAKIMPESEARREKK